VPPGKTPGDVTLPEPSRTAGRRAYPGDVGKFLLVIVVFAALVYTVLWLLERRRGGGAPARRRTTLPPAPHVSAPDDDEDFLRGLNRRRRPDQGHDKPTE
jgi:hypothetical protein